MSLLKKLFCSHKWQTHTKEIHKWEQQDIVDGTANWFNPVLETQQYKETTEVLICTECGKIKKIKY